MNTAFLLFLSCLYLFFGSVPANITTTQFLRDPEYIVSRNSTFRFGFFSPSGSTNRYAGIWYNNNDSDIFEVIWIANRDNPLNDSSGVLIISDDGDLQLLNGHNNTIWSSNIAANREVNNTVAQLLDSGNLVLLSNASGQGDIIWQTFEHPTDSFLPNMQVIADENTNTPGRLISWNSASDPSTGRFSAGINPRVLSEFFIWDGDRPYWRSGPWNGHVFIGVPSMYYFALVDGFRLDDNREGRLALSFSSASQRVTEHYVLTNKGIMVQKDWDENTRNWTSQWQSLESECDVYGRCGEYGNCNSNNSQICGCLRGFEPRNFQEWSEGNWSSGCIRRTSLQCGVMGAEEDDGFLRLSNVKVPDNAEMLSSVDEEHCRSQCLGNCSCLGYSYYLGIGCMIWTETMIDIREFSSVGVDLFVRLARSELDETGSRWRLILAITLGLGAVIFSLVIYCLWRRMRRQNEKNAMIEDTQLHSIKFEPDFNDVKLRDLPLFKFEELEAATDKFDERNKLGQGGFGPVFKGKLEGGQEIAVKRLSRASGQGLQEFMNEVDVISKLQHRNLVKLLGCCIDAEEKMLVYEYMPNKSLDAFLFDPQDQELLDWKKRLNIVEGTCRGLLYLHRDSRLRIIHRDLKPSNILLDEELNAKISDFGMARIFGGKEEQGSTKRVVGTYGYMSPEYAMEGRFSEKSDVYSFGVLLLEIVSGRKNTSFQDDDSMNLIGYAWDLRNQDNILSLIDPTINDPRFQDEILRCIEVGLLCVQELSEARPSISTIISMLDTEITYLPQPMQPLFVQSKMMRSPQKNGQENCSVSNGSFTSLVSGG